MQSRRIRRQLHGRNVAQREEAAVLERPEIPAEALGDRAKLIGRLFEREEDARFAAMRPVEEELQAEQGLSRAGSPLEDGGARARQPAAKHLVEPLHPRRHALRRPAWLGVECLRTLYPGKEPQSVGVDLEEVAARDVTRPPELEDLDLADCGKVVTPIDEPDDAVSDCELGVVRDLRLGVLADEKAQCSPGRRVDGEVVGERPYRCGLANDVPDRLEAVDDDNRRLLALHALGDRRERRLDALAPEHGTEIREDDFVVGKRSSKKENCCM